MKRLGIEGIESVKPSFLIQVGEVAESGVGAPG